MIEPSEEKKTPQTKRGMYGCLWFLMVLLIALLVAGGWVQFRFHFFTEIGNLYTLDQRVRRVSADLAQAQQMIAQNQTLLNKIQQPVNHAEALVHLANLNFSATHHAKSTVQILMRALDTLKSVDVPQANDLKSAISQDLAALQAYQTLDVKKILTQLIQLSKQLNSLPLIQSDTTLAPRAPITAEEVKSFWQRGWEASLETIKSLIIVQHRQFMPHPLITLQEQQLLKVYLQSLVTQATWGLIQYNEALYHQSLQQITAAVQQYYVQTKPNTSAVLSLLTQLQQVKMPEAKVLLEPKGEKV